MQRGFLLYSDNGSLTNDKKLICKLLLEQFNSAFSIPLSNKVVTDPVSFLCNIQCLLQEIRSIANKHQL